MAGSKQASAAQRNAGFATAKTGGPVGSNNDSADPNAKFVVPGDTPGSLGKNDRGDPGTPAIVYRGWGGIDLDKLTPEGMRAVCCMEALKQSDNMDLYSWTGKISSLSGDMLRMYLDGKVDIELLAKVRQEILQSDTFNRLSRAVTNDFVSTETKKAGRLLTPEEMTSKLQPFLDRYRRETYQVNGIERQKMYFYSDDRGLQPVIGGVTGLEVVSCRVTGKEYEIKISLQDSYDFDNRRDGPEYLAYRRFRNYLAGLLKARKYNEFWSEYQSNWDIGPTFANKLATFPVDKKTVFASFMYATEQAGFFNPLPWEVELSIKGSFPP